MYLASPFACIRESGWLLKYCLWNFVVRMNSAHDTAFQWIVLCFFVTSITAMVAPLDTAPTSSLTSSWRISFSALRTAGAGLVSSSSEIISILWPSTPLGVQLLDGHLHEHRLVLAVALEDTDLAAEVADLDDLGLRERGRGQETAGDEQRRQHHQPGESLHEFLLDGVVVDGVVVLTMRSDRICAIRPNPARTRTGSGAPAAGRVRPSASSYASRIATDARASRWPTAKSARL